MKKRAILIVSFGTSHMDTKEKTIDHIIKTVQKEYREEKIYEAFTSNIIIKKLRERDGISMLTVEGALVQMRKDGITDVLVQPTHILNGIENDKMKEEIKQYEIDFNSIVVGEPLLSRTEDYFFVMEHLLKEFGDIGEDDAVLLMGHGTDHYSNSSYAALNYMFRQRGFLNVYLGTVEAYPGLEEILMEMKQAGYKKIILTPFMIVAGEHAEIDMAGDQEDSWITQLQNQGYQVEVRMKGLGEYNFIGECLVKHLMDAESSYKAANKS